MNQLRRLLGRFSVLSRKPRWSSAHDVSAEGWSQHAGIVDIRFKLNGMPVRQSPLSAMTVNERLFEVGKLDQWDAAVRSRDRAIMVELIQSVEVNLPETLVDDVLKNPSFFGF